MLANVLSRSAMKSSSSFVSPSFGLGDVTEGLVGEGENTGELSLSSLKLKLFLLRDSAPVAERKKA